MWESAYFILFLPIPVNSRQFLPIACYSSLFQHISVYSSLFLNIPVYSNLFHPIPAYSSLFQPLPFHFSLCQPIPAYSPIPNLQSQIFNLKYPIVHFTTNWALCMLDLYFLLLPPGPLVEGSQRLPAILGNKMLLLCSYLSSAHL